MTDSHWVLNKEETHRLNCGPIVHINFLARKYDEIEKELNRGGIVRQTYQNHYISIERTNIYSGDIPRYLVKTNLVGEESIQRDVMGSAIMRAMSQHYVMRMLEQRIWKPKKIWVRSAIPIGCVVPIESIHLTSESVVELDVIWTGRCFVSVPTTDPDYRHPRSYRKYYSLYQDDYDDDDYEDDDCVICSI